MLPSIKRNEPNWVTNWFNEFFGDDFPMIRSAAATVPAINVREDDKHYHIELAAPGMTKHDFNIRVDDHRQLIIQMDHQDEHKGDCHDECKYLRHEFHYSHYEQTMQLPDNVDADEIKAKMDNGILYLSLKKTVPDSASQQTKVINVD